MLALATVCACVGFLPHGSELGLTLTLLVDVLSLVRAGADPARTQKPLPGIWRITVRSILLTEQEMLVCLKLLSFLCPGLEECEGLLCVDILRRAGVEVTIAAVGWGEDVRSARQISVVADAMAEELDYTVFDACFLPGGIPVCPT